MSAVRDEQVLLHKHTRREFRERMKDGELKACIIPVAATEQHLEHLAMEHDWRSVMHVTTEAAKRVHPNCLVAPSMNVGISEHHMSHIGTLTALPGSFLAVLHDTIRSMHHAGFRNILVVNGHGGNIAPCEGMWGQFQLRFQCNLQFLSYWTLLSKETAEKHLSTKRWPGHAQEFETAFAMAAFPENVRDEPMHDQTDKEPLAAKAEAGQAMIDEIVDELAKYVKGMIDGTNVSNNPPFFP